MKTNRLAREHGIVDQIDARLEVRPVVIGADEVRQSFGRIGPEVVDVVERAVIPQAADEVGVAKVAFHPLRVAGNVLDEAAGQVVGGDDLHPKLQAGIGDMGTHEPSSPRY